MFGWLRKGSKKKPVAAGTVEQIRHIEQRVVLIEKAQQEIIAILTEKAWSIDKVIIENMRTDKVELNLDRVDVKDLSGMLSIGINYGGSLVKLYGETKGEGSGAGSEGDTRAVEKYTGIFAAGIKESAAFVRPAGESAATPPSPEPKRCRPVINVQYGVRTDDRQG